MNEIINTLLSKIPDHQEKREPRSDVSIKCSELIRELEDGGRIYTINSEDRSLTHLSPTARECCVEVDSFLHRNTNGHTDEHVRFTPQTVDKEEMEEAKENLEKAIAEIEKQNKLSYVKQYSLLAFILFGIGVSIGIGIYTSFCSYLPI